MSAAAFKPLNVVLLAICALLPVALMKAYGFNLDFAPVFDIFSNPKSTVISERSFGRDADTISRLGVATMKGIKSAGVIPMIKHFPGHGNTAVDYHNGGRISQQRIDQSVKRIVLLKQKYRLSDESASMDDVLKYVGSKEHKSIAAQATAKISSYKPIFRFPLQK